MSGNFCLLNQSLLVLIHKKQKPLNSLEQPIKIQLLQMLLLMKKILAMESGQLLMAQAQFELMIIGAIIFGLKRMQS